MKSKAPTDKSDEIQIEQLNVVTYSGVLIGESPLILNAMSEKTRHELLYPSKENKRKSGNLKHDPLEEYRSSVYRLEADAPTLLAFPASGIKRSIMSAALDAKNTSKAQIGRLVWVKGTYLPVYGTPQIFMAPVRSADMNKTLDIRTRCILPKWAIPFEIQFVGDVLNSTSVINLLGRAGLTIGIGDWRSEKGSGTYGQFKVAPLSDSEAKAIMKQARTTQDFGMKSPSFFNSETQTLYKWFVETREVRGTKQNTKDKREAA